MQEGTNLLAIQGLNFGASNADFFVLAELEASTAGQYASDPHYFTAPTPGFANGVGTRDLGPIISLAGHLPDVPGTNDSLIFTCRVTQAFAPITNVTLNWRVMYGLNLTGANLETFLFDNVNLANVAPPWPTDADRPGDSLHRRGLSAYGNDPTNWFAAAPTAGRPDAESPAITSITRDYPELAGCAAFETGLCRRPVIAGFSCAAELRR